MHIFVSAAAVSSDNTVATDLAILALAISVGLAIGAIRIRGLKLGISGVLFSALIFGQSGFSIDKGVIDFLRDFALIIFMYAMGLQVGPGFGASLKADGIRLNALSLSVIILGALMTAAVAPLIPKSMTPGLYAGAFTTTPALAASQETLRGAPPTPEGDTAAARTALAYSITYPFGVIGPMLVVVALRMIFRVKVSDERAALVEAEERRRPRIETADIEVRAPEHAGQRLRDHPLLQTNHIFFSRLLRDGAMVVPTADTLVQVGDIYRAVGPREHLTELCMALGQKSGTDLSTVPGDVRRVDIVVTRTHVLRRSLLELDLIRRTGVTLASVNRAGVDLLPTRSLRLAFADRVTAVGPEAGLQMVQAEFGNSSESLNQSQLIPIFLGIVLGVIVGSIPLALPGLHSSLRIGLAGGSLLSAIALSRLGSVGSVVWYMPAAANQLFLNFGLAVFLACVGFRAGDHFIQRAAQSSGLTLFLWGGLITMLPVAIVGAFARIVLKMNFVSLSGWVAGAMSSSTTLLFAEEVTGSSAPAVIYAAVLPLSMLTPIICAQVLTIFTALH